MLQATKLLAQGAGLAPALVKRAATVTLDWDTRQKSRFDFTDSAGRHVGVFLARGTVVRGGDVLVAEDGSFIRVVAADQPVLVAPGGVARFEGDKVALVVAESREAAAAGATLVTLDLDDLPAVTDPRAALAERAPLVHEERGSNLLLHRPIRKGDVARGVAEADVVLDGEFDLSWQEHAFLQPEAGIAYLDEQGRVVVETAGQWLHEDRRQIAEMLRLPEEQVIVRYAAIGGAFGGREDLSVQHLLALAAWKLRRPVAMTWSRELYFGSGQSVFRSANVWMPLSASRPRIQCRKSSPL